MLLEERLECFLNSRLEGWTYQRLLRAHHAACQCCHIAVWRVLVWSSKNQLGEMMQYVDVAGECDWISM